MRSHFFPHLAPSEWRPQATRLTAETIGRKDCLGIIHLKDNPYYNICDPVLLFKLMWDLEPRNTLNFLHFLSPASGFETLQSAWEDKCYKSNKALYLFSTETLWAVHKNLTGLPYPQTGDKWKGRKKVLSHYELPAQLHCALKSLMVCWRDLSNHFPHLVMVTENPVILVPSLRLQYWDLVTVKPCYIIHALDIVNGLKAITSF